MPLSKLYIVHQTPATAGAEDGVSDRYSRIKKTMLDTKKYIVPVVEPPKQSSMPLAKTMHKPLLICNAKGEASASKSDQATVSSKNNEGEKNPKKGNTASIATEATIVSSAPAPKKKRKRQFNPNQLKPITTISSWILQDYFWEIEKQLNLIKLLPGRIVSSNPPKLRKYEFFKNQVKSATSRISLVFEEILKKIHDALHVRDVQIGLSWLEAVTFELFSAMNEIFKIHSPFATTLFKGLAYTWHRAFQIGSMMWDSKLQPKFTKKGDIDWRPSKNEENLLFMRFSDNNLFVKSQYVDMFRIWYSQAFYTLEAFVWKCNNESVPSGAIASASAEVNTSDAYQKKATCISQLVETVNKIKKMKP